MVRDFMEAMDTFYSTKESERPKDGVFELISFLDMEALMPPGQFAEAVGAEEMARVLGR